MALQIGQRVRQFRYHRRLTQAALAERAGLNQGFISEIERGNRNPSHATLEALAAALRVSPAMLVGGGAEHDAPQIEETRELPVYGTIPCGPPATSQETTERYPVLRHLWRPDRYVLRLTLDSLEPTLKPDDLVLVQSRPGVDPAYVQGKICACLVDGQPTLKRVSVEQHNGRRVVILRGDNPATPPVLVDERHEFSIQGVAIYLVQRAL